MTRNHLEYAPEVAEALAGGKPVVALESTIITHGMPYPQNLDTALSVAAEVRNAGAVPATIAVMGGKIRVGLDHESLGNLARTKGAHKLSRADLPWCLMRGETGATTVAATMLCAHMAGIATFATGGIGGVHRGAAQSFDISADLLELAQTPVIVVAAGAKAILDLPKTLEVLETNGVPVLCYQSDVFPAFWSRNSAFPAPLRVDSVAEIAQHHDMRRTLGMKGGSLVANPIPHESEIAQEVLTPWIEQALAEAAAQQIVGKDVTPFLLARLFDLSNGETLRANIALVHNNARLSAKIARALCDLGE